MSNPTYFELEQALENAYAHTQSLTAIIISLMASQAWPKATFSREQLQEFYEKYIVEVVPADDDTITLQLKEK